MNRVYTPSTQHTLRSPPMLPSGPTHCHSHHCVLTVSGTHHKVRLSTVRSKAVCATQQVFCPEQSTVHTSMNTPCAQTCHTTASHLIEHAHTWPSSTSTGTGGSAPPHTLSGSANGQEHVTLLTVPGTMTFTLHLVNTLRGT